MGTETTVPSYPGKLVQKQYRVIQGNWYRNSTELSREIGTETSKLAGTELSCTLFDDCYLIRVLFQVYPKYSIMRVSEAGSSKTFFLVNSCRQCKICGNGHFIASRHGKQQI